MRSSDNPSAAAMWEEWTVVVLGDGPVGKSSLVTWVSFTLVWLLAEETTV
jgi:hypothetical protein